MQEQNKHIDDFFREQLGGYTETPPAANWKNLEQKLDSTATPGSIVSYYKWLRYGIIIAVVAVVVFFSARRVMEPSGSSQNDARQLALNTQSNEGNIANGNAVAGDYNEHPSNSENTNKNANENTNTNESTAGVNTANSAEVTSQNATAAQVSNVNNAGSAQNQALAANTQPSTVNKTATTQNGQQATNAAQGSVGNSSVATSVRNVGISNAVNPHEATSAGKGANANNAAVNNTANSFASNNRQGGNAVNTGGTSNNHTTANPKVAVSNAAIGHNAAPANSTASKQVQHQNAMNVNNSQRHLTAVKESSTIMSSSSASYTKNTSAKAAATLAQPPYKHTNAADGALNKDDHSTATATKVGSRMKKGHIEAFAGKTSTVSYSQSSMKTVKPDQHKTAWQSKGNNSIAVSNSEQAGEGTEGAQGNGHASNSNPFRIPDNTGKGSAAASAGVENIDNTGKVAINENAVGTGNKGGQASNGGNSGSAATSSGNVNPASNATAANTTGAASAGTGANINANSNIASNRYNPEAAAMGNVITKPQAAANINGSNAQPAANKPQQKTKKIYKPLVVESGVKIGYEVGFKHFAANKYVISPYIEYGRGHWAISLQPALKIARMNHTGNLGDAQVYYNVTRDPSYRLVADNVYAQTQTEERTYAYNEAHDSIVVTHHIATKSFSELEVPLLVNYKINDNLKVYGGAILDYTTIVQIQEDRHIGYYNRDTSITQVFSTLGPAPDVPEANTVFHYPGVAYSLYSTKGYDNVSSSKLTFGYMLGFNYTIKDRYMLDISMLQNISNMNYIPNESIKGIYTQPYFRVSAGYKFLQAKKKRR